MSVIGHGVEIVTSSTRPTSPFDGMQIYETDTKKTLVYNGSSWVEVNDLDSADGLSASGQTKLDNQGLIYLTANSFTSALTVNITNVFTADYTNYRLVLSCDASTSDRSGTIRMMNNTTANSSSNYVRTFIQGAGGVAYSATNTGLTEWDTVFLADDLGTGRNNAIINVFSPFTTDREVTISTLTYSTTRAIRMAGGNYTATTSFDGIQLYLNTSATMTGKYWLYGLKGT